MEVHLKIGKTVIENNISVTDVVINGEERQVTIHPAKYATIREILVQAVKYLTDEKVDKNIQA